MCSCTSSRMCAACTAGKYAVCVFLTIAAFLATYAVYFTHFAGTMYRTGSLESSVALLTFVLTISAWWRAVRKSCPCNSACACGPSCDCGSSCGCCGPDMKPKGKTIEFKKAPKLPAKKKASVYQSSSY